MIKHVSKNLLQTEYLLFLSLLLFLIYWESNGVDFDNIERSIPPNNNTKTTNNEQPVDIFKKL